MYYAYVTKIKDVRKHSNADRLQVGTCFDSNVIVGLNTQDGELGIYFPIDGKLGIEFATKNVLLRRKDENGNNVGGYLDPEKRNIKAIKLRGEKSDGLFMPLESLKSFTDIAKLKEGDKIDILNGVLICEKYIPKSNKVQGTPKNKKINKKEKSYPFFVEHADTEQLDYNLNQFKPGDTCYITLKMHGTSQRTAHTIVQSPTFIGKILDKFRKRWSFISGTRRVVLKTYDKGYYESDAFRKQYHDFFKTRLEKGEEIFYEVVGYTETGATIMGECDNKATKDDEFIKQYGEKTIFNYGCPVGASQIYVYRMTMTNEDGVIVEYPWELVKRRCEEMGVNHVPEFEKFLFTTEEDLKERTEKYLDMVDPIGKTHVSEGVVVRLDNRKTFKAFKKKGWYFKVLEGIIKDNAETPDMEESQDI